MDWLSILALFHGQRQSSSERQAVQADNAVIHNAEQELPSAERTPDVSTLRSRDTLLPLAPVVTMFMLWGFHGGLSDVLGKRFQDILHISKGQAALLQASYYSAFLIGPFIHGWLMRKIGYKWSFVVALDICCVGAFLYWPASDTKMFSLYCLAQFVLSSGLAALATACTPYLTICGPTRWSELRLNLAFAFEQLAYLCALFWARQFIFDENGHIFKAMHRDDEVLLVIKSTYILIGTVSSCIGAVSAFLKIPEISDEDMSYEARRTASSTEWTANGLHKQCMFWFGVLAMFCYCGAQSSISAFFMNIILEIEPSLSNTGALNQMIIAVAVFAGTRFILAIMMRVVKPRHIVLASMFAILTLSGTLSQVHGRSGIKILIAYWSMKAPMYPTIYSTSMRGLGIHTKMGASILIAAISGGALFTPLFGVTADATDCQTALAIPFSGFLIVFSFVVYINFIKATELDGFRSVQPAPRSRQGYDDRGSVAVELSESQASPIPSTEPPVVSTASIPADTETKSPSKVSVRIVEHSENDLNEISHRD